MSGSIRSRESFSMNPVNLDIKRSTFNRNSQHKTTFNAGDLVPLYVDQVLPGDTFKMDVSCVTRASTFIYPVMDNCFLDYFAFFVPSRILWTH